MRGGEPRQRAPYDHLVDFRKKLRAEVLHGAVVRRARALQRLVRDRRLWCFLEHLGLERRLRCQRAPRVVAGPDDLGLWACDLAFGARQRCGLGAAQDARSAACGEHGLEWLRQNCVFSGTLRCALLQSEGLYSPARTNLGLAMLWLRKNGRRLYADDSYETLRLGAL